MLWSNVQTIGRKIQTIESSSNQFIILKGLVSYATDKQGSDVCLDSVDVVGFNSYPGWFQGSDDLEANLASIPPFVRGEATLSKSKFPNKPFIKSEIGGESIYGWDDALNGLWTQNYQV